MVSNIKNEAENKCETDNEKENICDKMYGMGSSHKLTDSECDLNFLSEKMNSVPVSAEYKDFANVFTRPDGGYIEQLKHYVNIDLYRYDDSILRNKREKAKLLYFSYKIMGEFRLSL